MAAHARRGARESLGQVFSLDDEPEERAFLEAGEVLEQRYSDPDLPATTRALFDKYGDRAYLNVPLVFNGQPVGVLVLVEKDQERHWPPDEVALATGSPSRRPWPSSTPACTSASRTRR